MKKLSVAAMVLMLASCGGGGYGSNSPNVKNASPGGIWQGVDSVSGLQVTGLIDESGQGHFIRSDGVQYVGTAMTTGNSFSAQIAGYTQFGTAFADGSTSGTGSVTGTINERVSITLNTQFTTSVGTMSSGTLDLTFNALYNQGSSLAAIAGSYTETSDGTVVTVDSAGAVSAQDATTGCVINGTVSIIDATYNAYSVSLGYASCTGTAAALNGVTFTGLATLNTTVSPVQAIAGLTGMSGATTYAIVVTLNKS